MGVIIFDPVTVGSQLPVAVRITPSDCSQIASATYMIVRQKDECGTVWDPGGACRVSSDEFGTIVSTPDYIDFARVDTYFVRFRIEWEDGQVDTSAVAQVPVVNPGGSCC